MHADTARGLHAGQPVAAARELELSFPRQRVAHGPARKWRRLLARAPPKAVRREWGLPRAPYGSQTQQECLAREDAQAAEDGGEFAASV